MRKVVLALLFVLGISSMLFAQGTGTISGTVTDPAGAVLPNAKVTVTNTATGLVRTFTTSDTGTFSIPNLPVGAYEVTAEAQGFKVAKTSNVVLQVAGVSTVNFKLEVGSVAQSVEVAADAVAPVELDTSQVSNVVNNAQIESLPLLTRNPYSLILLSPGTMQSNSGLGGISVNGSRERNNNFMLDGSDNNDTSVPGGGSGVASLSPEATQEFRVITNTFMPEYGRNTGAIIDVVTKSGTNNFHGEGHWFGRYDRLGARDWFNTVNEDGTMQEKNPYNRNIYGFSFGGPILKNKTFFFVNNEWQRFRTTLTNLAVVPNADVRTGSFMFGDTPIDMTNPESEGNWYGLTIDPLVQQILNAYPTPNGEATSPLTSYYRFASPSKYDFWGITAKIDHRFNDNNSLMLRVIRNKDKDPNANRSEFLPGLAQEAYDGTSNGISSSFTSVLSSSLINDVRAGFNRVDATFGCGGLDALDQFGGVDAFGRGRDFNFPIISGWGCQFIGDSNGQARRTGTYSISDQLSWIKGTHSFKFGAEFRFVFEDGYNAFSSRESINFSHATTFGEPAWDVDGTTDQHNLLWALGGIVTSHSQSQFFDASGNRTPDDNRRFRQREYAAYIQDSWKVTPQFTLNYGIRYSFNGVPYEKDGNFSNFYGDPARAVDVDTDDDGVADSLAFTLVGPQYDRNLYKNDWSNIQPRVGFAYDPFGKGKTSIRGAFGVFNDRLFGNLFGNARGNPPFQQDFFDYAFFETGGEFITPISMIDRPATQTPSLYVADGAGIFPVIIDQNLKMPRSINWNFGIQHEIFDNTTLEVNYVGSRGSRQMRVVDGNPPNPALVKALIEEEGIPESWLQFDELWFGYEYGDLPYNPVLNNAFYSAALNKSIGESRYNSLQTQLSRRMTDGLQVQVAYTWAHAIDNASDPLVPAAGNRSFPRNSYDLKREWGNSDFDMRHRAVINYTYDLPFGKGKSLAATGVLGRILEGWSTSGIISAQTGHPYEVLTNRDSQHSGVSDRAYLIGDPFNVIRTQKNITGLNRAAFTYSPYGVGSNLGRNQFFGPGYKNFDMTFSKRTTLREGMTVDFRTEIYNVFNNVNFSQPVNTIQSSTFGKSQGQIGRSDGTTGARQLQFGVKFEF